MIVAACNATESWRPKKINVLMMEKLSGYDVPQNTSRSSEGDALIQDTKESSSYSVVMNVYAEDHADHLRLAIDSVLNQTLSPDELIIAVDGPVGEAIKQVLENVSSSNSVRVIYIGKNVGLGPARHTAISHARNSFVGVMDADDICLPGRFEKQIEILRHEQVDVLGGWIEEFDEDPVDTHELRLRMTPLTHDEIYDFGKRRNPMNHVTLMFRKDAYDAVGGYRSVLYFEDYDLIIRMLLAGFRFKNNAEVLVQVRCGRNMFDRRRGIDYIKTELQFMWGMYCQGYTSLCQFVLNASIRIPVRVVPASMRRWLYLKFLRGNLAKNEIARP